MLPFLKLIRLPNLLIIAFTQYMIRLCLIKPILDLKEFELQLGQVDFLLLVLSTVFIAAAGYIINDYFDVRMDYINKPEQLVIDKGISRRTAMGAHAVLSFLGAATGVYLSWRSNILLSGGVLFVVSVAGLWFYSTSFKYKFLTGNLVVSLLTAMVPFMVALFEVPKLIPAYHPQLMRQLSEYGFASTTTILLWTGAYALFAFMISLIREIVKDMEDMEGDKEYGCRTLPIVLGVKKTKMIVYALILITIGGVGYCQNFLHQQLNDNYSPLYFLILVQLPLLILLIQIIRATEKKHFHSGSQLLKLTMLAGICYLFLFRYLLG